MQRSNVSRIKVVVLGVVVGLLAAGGSAWADFTFGEPTNFGIVNSSSCDDGLNISSDGLSIIFSSDRPNMGTWDLYIATRETTKDEWGPAVNLGSPVNGSRSESYPSVSKDGLELFYTAPSWQSGWTQFGGADLWVSTRSSISDDWSAPENLGPVINTANHDTEPSISADGLELFFSSDRPGGHGEWNIWVTRRQSKSDPWQEPVNLGPKINAGTEGTPNISANGLVLLFASSRPGGHGRSDIWLSRRKTKDDPWQEPVNVGSPVNDGGGQWAPCMSHDGSMLYFTDSGKSPRYGCFDIWQAPVIPLVDFNGDGMVDLVDLLMLIDNWGTDASFCDIGPTPWGDGTVDAADLEVLMSHWGSVWNRRALIAHWKLDETEGEVACDSAGGDHNGALTGDPVWQPTGGKIGGALLLDGVDDYVSTPPVLDPAAGPFSVFAWVKGGTPGQVILSQQAGMDWLLAEPGTGCLMTDLRSTGRLARVLRSQTLITDGAWHRVGLVWEASNRILYVDDIEVARDTQTILAASGGELRMGTGTQFAPGTFWTGLIDDVRIYNRAVRP